MRLLKWWFSAFLMILLSYVVCGQTFALIAATAYLTTGFLLTVSKP